MSTIESRVNERLAFKAMGTPIPFDGEMRFPNLRSRSSGTRTPIGQSRRPVESTISPASDDDSAHQEFLKRRDHLVQMGRKNPQVRLAAFLVALVHLNPDQGTGSLVISEKTDSYFVADLLSLEIKDLAQHMLQFQLQGLVVPMPNGGLRVTNLAGLERLADGDLSKESLPSDNDLSEGPKIIVEPPRVYTRTTAEAVSLSQIDRATRFDVAFMTSAACLIVALAVAFGIVGL